MDRHRRRRKAIMSRSVTRMQKHSSIKGAFKNVLLSTSGAFRVVAPYAVFHREEEPTENETFNYYLQQKPELLLADLTNYLSDMVDLHNVLLDSTWMLKSMIKAAGVNLYLVDKPGKEIYLVSNHNISERNRLTWTIRQGTTVAAYVADTLDNVMVDQVRTDSRFPRGIAYNPYVGSVICCPIIISKVDCFAVVELYRKIDEPVFTADDLEFTTMVTSWISSAIYENHGRLAEQQKKELNNYLLDLTRCYFADPALLINIISEMVNFSRTTLGASRASFFLFEEVRSDGSIVANLYDEREEYATSLQRNAKVVLRYGTAAYVARTGEVINIRDQTTDPRFQKETLSSGPITRSVLCMPLSEGDEIMGVVQVKNKKDGGYFDLLDEKLLKSFAVFCSMACHYSYSYKTMRRNEIISLSHSKMLTYHLRPCIHDFRDFFDFPFPKIPADFNTFSWYISDDLKPIMHKYVLYMFTKIIGSCFLVMESAMRFILEVKRAYKDNIYHNFEHAFTFVHSVYVVLSRNAERFTHIEKKGLLIGGFCHNIDHSGYSNNALQLLSEDRALLYEESAQERHCFQITRQILNVNCAIFRYATPNEHAQTLNEVKRAILGTSWFNYFKVRGLLLNEFRQKTFSWENPTHRYYVKSVIMSTAESSFCWKSCKIVVDILKRYFQERFLEGQALRKLGKTPTQDMNYDEKAMVSEEFVLLTNVWLPCVQLLKVALPNTTDCFHLTSKLARNISGATDLKIWILT